MMLNTSTLLRKQFQIVFLHSSSPGTDQNIPTPSAQRINRVLITRMQKKADWQSRHVRIIDGDSAGGGYQDSLKNRTEKRVKR